jgi:hypothetical protein
MEITPAIANLDPNDRRPSVKECTIKSIIMKEMPKIKTMIPTVKNTLNSGNSFFVDILFHHDC